MSAETVENTESEAVNQNEETSEQTENDPRGTSENQPREKTKTYGTYAPPVDLSSLPDDIRSPIESRFAHLSRLMKKNETNSERQMHEWRELAKMQSDKIAELTNGFGQVVDHLENRNYAETEAQITRNMEDALQSGDTARYVKEHAKFTEIQVKKNTPKPQPVKKEVQNQPANASQIARSALEDGELTQDEVTLVDSWQSEKDESGRLVRPWAFNPEGGPPRVGTPYHAGLIEMNSILSNPAYSDLSWDKKLAELDRRMGVQKSTTRQTVMGGSLTTQKKQNRITLSPELQRMAVRTKFGGSKAKTDAEHIDAYRKQVESYQSQQRSR